MGEAEPKTRAFLVTMEGCPHCDDYKEKFPDFSKAAIEIEVSQQRCGELPGITAPGEAVCHTGADLLIAARENATPTCVITTDDGEVRRCSKSEEDSVKKGVIPKIEYAPRPSKFKFISDGF